MCMACGALWPGLAACGPRCSRHAVPVAPNLLDRKLTAAAPNPVWRADLPPMPTSEGWLHMAAAMDLRTRKIVGWSRRDHLRAELATSALVMATQRPCPGPSLTHHLDRGVQCAGTSYQEARAAAGIRLSMSRRGNALDNAPRESFFHTLKTEPVHHRT